MKNKNSRNKLDSINPMQSLMTGFHPADSQNRNNF